jgi:hypothetical protein
VIELVDAGVGEDADDGETFVAAEIDFPANGADVIGKDGSGGLLGDEDVGGVVFVVGSEVAACEERDAEGGGVGGADPADVGSGLVAGINGMPRGSSEMVATDCTPGICATAARERSLKAARARSEWATSSPY